ncbi:MAG: hypothetical protein AB1896_21495, partial [Thermodesulfobacteriota bacterium]
MTRTLYPVKAILVGLILSQIWAGLFVYLADLDLYDQITALAEAGYLVVPNRLVLPSLKEVGPAFAGGLFYTLTLGAGLSTAALGLAWFLDRVWGRSRVGLLAAAVPWVAVLVAANLKGFDWMLTLTLLTVPPAVFGLALWWMPLKEKSRSWPARAAFLLPVAIIVAVWGSLWSDTLFLDVRDYLLWSNPAGKSLVDFYYRYTMYPAEAFKSLGQKTMRTGRVVADDPGRRAALSGALARYDYLLVGREGPVDLEAVVQDDGLTLFHRDRPVLELETGRFLADPGPDLDLFSRMT